MSGSLPSGSQDLGLASAPLSPVCFPQSRGSSPVSHLAEWGRVREDPWDLGGDISRIGSSHCQKSLGSVSLIIPDPLCSPIFTCPAAKEGLLPLFSAPPLIIGRHEAAVISDTSHLVPEDMRAYLRLGLPTCRGGKKGPEERRKGPQWRHATFTPLSARDLVRQ